MICPFRTGIGYDVHRFIADRPFILGGVTIPFEKGLLGHSDADVLVHALMDSLLGAASLGDIGTHFPDSDPSYKDISSLELLSRVHKLLKTRGYAIVNCDSVIICERPKLMKFADEMKKNISAALGRLALDCIGIKATTSEGCGFTGRGEAVAVHSVSLLSFEQQSS